MLWNAKLSPSETGYALSVLNKLNRNYTLVTGPPQGLNVIIAEVHEDDLTVLTCECGKVHDRLTCDTHKIFIGQVNAYQDLYNGI